MKPHFIFPTCVCAAAIILGCDGALSVPGSQHRQAVATAAEVIIEAPAPEFVEEGATVNGTVVVAPADLNDYVFINGGYYYWHPGLNVWVHAHHERDWQPPKGVKIYNHWSDHPNYHKK